MDGACDIQPEREILHQLIQQIPQEERTSPTGKAVIEMLGAIGAGGWKIMSLQGFRTQSKALDGLISILDNHAKGHQEAIQAAAEHQKKNWKIFESLCKKAGGLLTTAECKAASDQDFQKLRTEYTNAMKTVRMEIADGMLKQCVLSSGVVVVTQIFALKAIWKQIDEAKNCINDRRHEMQAAMDMIEGLVVKLRAEQQQFSICLMEGAKFGKRKVLLDGIEDTVRDISDEIVKMQGLIVECRVETNGKKQQLITTDQAMTLSLVANGAHFGVNMTQFLGGVLNGSAPFVFMAAGMLTLHAAVMAGGVATKVMTKKTIQECNQFYAELLRCEVKAAKMKQEEKEVRDWIKRIRDTFEEEKAAGRDELLVYRGVIAVLLAICIYYFFMA